MADNLKQTIGIFGGTFDPVHRGHIQIAEKVLTELVLKEIRFIPCFQSPLREKPAATTQQRLTMLQLALRNYTQFVIDDREIKQSKTSFMVNTLKSLRKDFPNTPFCFILGDDAFSKLNLWYEYQQLFSLTHFIVISRKKNCLPNEFKNRLTQNKNELQKQLAGKIYLLNIEPIPISSTQIRKNIKQNKEMLNPDVYQFIFDKKLY